jgi:hypothetical protein
MDAARNSVFCFKDPRLHHLNSEFRRESLQIRHLDKFSDQPQNLAAAIDEIIKFNCDINEFNYMHDLAIKIDRIR